MERIHQEEFRCSAFTFQHDRPLEFAVWSWQTPERVCGYYVVYRCLLAALFLSVLVACGTLDDHPDTWFIYLTDLGFLIQTVNLVASAAVPVQLLLYYRKDEMRSEMTLLTKLSWFMYTSTNLITIVITAEYWAFLYIPGREIGAINFLVHAFNTITSIVDLFIGKRPYRLLHFFHPLVWLMAYTAFSAIYWAAGGRNGDGLSCIYAFLDWEDLEITVPFVAIGLFVVVPLLHILLWVLHKLRDALFSCTPPKNERKVEGRSNPVYEDEMYF